MWVPPWIVRRLVIAPGVFLAAGCLLVSLPLWLIAAALASRLVSGRWRVLRVCWFIFVYLAWEALALLALLGLWLASGLGWKQRSAAFEAAHYRLMAWFLHNVIGSARRTFTIELVGEDDLHAELANASRALLIFSRHVGPGDSFFLADELVNRMGLRPRIVLKDVMRLDPAVDIMLSRLPNRFVPSKGRAGGAAVEAIGELAAGLEAGDALIIFPEGANFTPRRRQRAIDHLERTGRRDLARRARSLTHLMPPKPTGALAAIDAAPTADVIFYGHVGLERLSTPGDLWRGIPMDSPVRTRRWLVRADELPAPGDRELWLYDTWEQLDTWIEQRLEPVDQQWSDRRSDDD